MTRLLPPLAISFAAALVLLVACSGDSTLSGGGTHGTPDAGGDAQDGSSNGNDGSGPIDTGGNPMDSNMNLGQPCDPSMAGMCGPGLLCCPVSGNVRDGDVLTACMNPHNAPDACP